MSVSFILHVRAFEWLVGPQILLDYSANPVTQDEFQLITHVSLTRTVVTRTVAEWNGKPNGVCLVVLFLGSASLALSDHGAVLVFTGHRRLACLGLFVVCQHVALTQIYFERGRGFFPNAFFNWNVRVARECRLIKPHDGLPFDARHVLINACCVGRVFIDFVSLFFCCSVHPCDGPIESTIGDVRADFDFYFVGGCRS